MRITLDMPDDVKGIFVNYLFYGRETGRYGIAVKVIESSELIDGTVIEIDPSKQLSRKTSKPIDSDKIKALCKKKNMKLVDLARKAGYERSSITSKLSQGEMSDCLREDIATVLGVEPDELLRRR